MKLVRLKKNLKQVKVFGQFLMVKSVKAMGLLSRLVLASRVTGGFYGPGQTAKISTGTMVLKSEDCADSDGLSNLYLNGFVCN